MAILIGDCKKQHSEYKIMYVAYTTSSNNIYLFQFKKLTVYNTVVE